MPGNKSLDLSFCLADRVTWPEIGSLWQHYNGDLYSVVMFTNRQPERQDKYPTTIVYRNIGNGEDYSRPLADWHRSVTNTGKRVNEHPGFDSRADDVISG